MFIKEKFSKLIKDICYIETGGIAKYSPSFAWGAIGFAALVFICYQFFPEIGGWNFLVAAIVVILSFIGYISIANHLEQKAIIQRCQRIMKKHPELAHIWSKNILALTKNDYEELSNLKDVSVEDYAMMLSLWDKIYLRDKT